MNVVIRAMPQFHSVQFFYYTAKQGSEKKSQRIKDSVKFQKAVKKGRVGRPSISDEVISQVLDKLKSGDSYRTIHQNVSYKIKFGKIKHVSIATICKIANSTGKYLGGMLIYDLEA